MTGPRAQEILSILVRMLVSNTNPSAVHVLLNRSLRPAPDDDPNVIVVMQLSNAASITETEYAALVVPEVEAALAKYFGVKELKVTF